MNDCSYAEGHSNRREVENGVAAAGNNNNNNNNNINVFNDGMLSVSSSDLSSLDEFERRAGSGREVKDIVSERRHRRRCCFFIKGLCLGCVPIVIILVIVFLVGEHVQRKNQRKAPTISELYNTTKVCAVDTSQFGSDRNTTGVAVPFTTYDNALEATQNGQEVAHCGPCGKCSNPSDLFLFSYDTNILDVISENCAWRTITGYPSVKKCLRGKIGFTPGCQDCFGEFVNCGTKQCAFICLHSKFYGDDDCQICRYRRCGASFLSCSGVSRKRLGFIDQTSKNEDISHSDGVCFDHEIEWQ